MLEFKSVDMVCRWRKTLGKDDSDVEDYRLIYTPNFGLEKLPIEIVCQGAKK